MVRTAAVLTSRQILDLSERGGCGIFCQIGVGEGPREQGEMSGSEAPGRSFWKEDSSR